MTEFTRRHVVRLGLAGTAALPLAALTARRAAAATHQVQISGFAFNPPELEVAVGDTVVFINSDGAPHTATSVDGLFDTGTIAPGAQGQATIEGAGAFEYTCRFHPSMGGVIIAG